MISNHINKNKRNHAKIPLHSGCKDNWHWDKREKSHEVLLYGPNLQTAHFHPKWSNGTAGVRGTRVLNRYLARYYWEIVVSDRIFGTSMMFGVCTKSSRLHADLFVNMLGEDQNGWGLSHKGLLWHGGKWQTYTKPFRENESTTIGLLFDSREGTLSYYKDGVPLGVAFTGLHLIKEDLYPMISSTAAKTEMTLSNMKREYFNLQDRCRDVIRKRMKSDNDITKLQLPSRIEIYLKEDKDEDNNQNVIQSEERRANYKTSSLNHFRQYTCGETHEIWNFPKTPVSTANPPFLEL